MAEEEDQIEITVEKSTIKSDEMKEKIIKICKQTIDYGLKEEDMEDLEKELKNTLESEIEGCCFKPFIGNSNSANIKSDQVLNLKFEGDEEEIIDLAIYYIQ